MEKILKATTFKASSMEQTSAQVCSFHNNNNPKFEIIQIVTVPVEYQEYVNVKKTVFHTTLYYYETKTTNQADNSKD